MFVIIALGFATSAKGQLFDCDGQLLVSMSDDDATTIYRPRFIPFGTPYFSPLARYEGITLDALGFNSKDSYIYAVQQETNAIMRLRRDNTLELVGEVAGISELHVNAGDCTPEGQYMCHDYELQQLLIFDVVDGFALDQSIDLYWDPEAGVGSAFTTRLFDIAIDPNDPSLAYAHQGRADDVALLPVVSRGRVLRIRIDPTDSRVGMVTPLNRVTEPAHIGALLFSPQSQLFGFGGSGDGLNPPQGRLYNINTITGTADVTVVAQQPTMLSDGCSCPFSFTFTSRVPAEGMYCNNDRKTFVLTIANNSFVPVEDVLLTDTLPDGMIIEGLSDSFIGTVAAGTGIGSNILRIENLDIPAKTTVELLIDVLSIDAKVGGTHKQAFLKNMPERFGGDIPSDDLGTPSVPRDSSYFFVTARELEDVTWELVPPTDCIAADDGKIILTSPQFFAGQAFEVRLRNKIGWEEVTYEMVADENNSFAVDSLTPGEYQVFSVRSLSENCSLALKDTTIVLDAPNDQLEFTASSNTPICEGQAIVLNSSMTPQGDIRWTGPQSLGSEEVAVVIDDASTARSGEYKVVATYGYCTQTRLLPVDVLPQLTASMSGDTNYCQRDDLLLAVTSDSDSILYQWTLPSGGLIADSMLTIPSVVDADSGYYRAIGTNGACYDTVGANVTVLPTPTVTMDRTIYTDFCGDVELKPTVTGDTDVTYSWSPTEGLSCTDCPSPQVQAIVQPTYEVMVENSYRCTDSATVAINLDKLTLVHSPNIMRRGSAMGNGEFVVYPSCVVDYIQSLQVYDRWGNTVYQLSDTDPSAASSYWDGSVNGSSGLSAVYMWRAIVQLVDGSVRQVTGDVTLLGK